jgi:type I restriction enzyme R subunit
MTDHNRTPEQRARAAIDTKLEQAGWRVQSMRQIDFGAGTGVAVREYPTLGVGVLEEA